jgi:hypothetical protein
MIVLLGLDPPESCAWVTKLDSLPHPPALEYTGFMIRCDERMSSETLIEWWKAMRSHRPHIPIGGVVSRNAAFVLELLDREVHLWPAIEATALHENRLPMHVLESILRRTVEGLILERWKNRWNLDAPGARALARATASTGASGGRIKTLIRKLRCSETTLRRRFAACGLPDPGSLLRTARFVSVEIRVELGTAEDAACIAAGWSDLKSYRHALARRDS